MSKQKQKNGKHKSKYKQKGISFMRLNIMSTACDKIKLYIDKRASVRIIKGVPIIHYSFFDKTNRVASRRQFTEVQATALMMELR